MYHSVEQIRKLKEEKRSVLQSIYAEHDLDVIYEKQSVLGAMSISIFTDVASAVMPTLQEDGVGNVVWSQISLRLERLTFTSIPTGEEIREKYRAIYNNPVSISIDGEEPPLRTPTEVKDVRLPKLLIRLAAHGIVLPVILHLPRGPVFALVKFASVVSCGITVIEVVKYFRRSSKKTGKASSPPHKRNAADKPDFEEMCALAVQEVYLENDRRLCRWFERLEEITVEEIDNALRNKEN